MTNLPPANLFAWQGHSQWRVLDAQSSSLLGFLHAWQAWRADPLKCPRLHWVAWLGNPGAHFAELMDAQLPRDLQPLAEQLREQLWGVLPGFHRMALDDQHVLLTLCVGDVGKVLAQLQFAADTVLWRASDCDVPRLKGLARCCQRGTRIGIHVPQAGSANWGKAAASCGFAVDESAQGAWRLARYEPAWALRKIPPLAPRPGTCAVIGAGLAGSAVAASLARRGWQVTVLDAADCPASGASGLPAGLLAPHVSRDDSSLSRLSRAGVRISLQHATELLAQGSDCALTGVLERLMPSPLPAARPTLPASWQGEFAAPACDWSRPATPAELQACGLPAASAAWLHAHAGWIKPAALVRAWLASPGVCFQGGARVERVVHSPEGWRVLGRLNGASSVLAQADLVVVAAAMGSIELLSDLAASAPTPVRPPALLPVRGQVMWAWQESVDRPEWASARGPINGHGSFIANVPADAHSQGVGKAFWIAGASYERGSTDLAFNPQDQTSNLAQLRALLPNAALPDPAELNAWVGVRCTTPDRLPRVMQLTCSAQGNDPGVWLCSAMGSRGLTFAALCAELLAAQLHGEPLPVERNLAALLSG